jgi:hypothetical protein
MRPSAFLCLLVLVCPLRLGAQQQPTRDARALLVLAQSLNAAGGVQAVAAVKDFTATGTITYNWAGQRVEGSVTFRGLGLDDFRLDAVLPGGTRSWAVSNLAGALKETDGTVTSIPLHNAVNLGGLTFPYFAMLAALVDTTTTVTYVGPVQVNGAQAYQVRVARTLGAQGAGAATVEQMTTRDFFVDAGNYLPVAIRDTTHPIRGASEAYLHGIEFSGYQAVSGLRVPFSIAEKVGGQTIWMARISSVSFNTGLADADFQLQSP